MQLYEVKDISLAPGGHRKIEWVRHNMPLLRGLEEGTAAALVIQSDYDAGYLSLLSVLETLEGRRPEDQTLDCYTVTAENMFTDPMDQILFPVA